jgi:hypothetical protein
LNRARRRLVDGTAARYLRSIDPGRLRDLDDVLQEVGGWDAVEDRGGGTFYLRRKPFLHFHAGHDTRRADVRSADGWVQVDLPEPSTAAVRRQLLTVLREEYVLRTAGSSAARTRPPDRPARSAKPARPGSL